MQTVKKIVKDICPAFIMNPLLRWRSARRNKECVGRSTEEVFNRIYDGHSWGGVSVSGEGSDLPQTQSVRSHLPALVARYNIQTLLDAPCGDFHWMKLVNLEGIQYIGGDIVPKLVDDNQRTYGSASRRFIHLDLMRDALPKADLLLCRDCLIHLSNNDLRMALQNIAKSEIKFLLTTTYPQLSANTDIVTGDFRAINLRRDPWNLPEPVDRIAEDLFADNRDNPNFIRELGLWRVSDLQARL